MNHLYFIALISGLSLAGEALNHFIPLPIPGSIYGLVLLLALLLTGLVKLEKIRTGGNFLISLMPVMFIAPSVGLINSYAAIKDSLVSIVAVCVLSTFVVMGVTGFVVQRLMKRNAGEGCSHE